MYLPFVFVMRSVSRVNDHIAKKGKINMSYLKQGLMVSLLSLSSVFALNIEYLATYSCDEARLQDMAITGPSNFDQDACEQGFLAGYKDFYQSDSLVENDVEKMASIYANGSNDLSLRKWFIVGYDLAEHLVDYNPCLAESYCSEKTVNSQLEKRFDAEGKIEGCKVGFAAFSGTREDVQGYRSMVDSLTGEIASMDDETKAFKEGYYDGAVQAFRCQ